MIAARRTLGGWRRGVYTRDQLVDAFVGGGAANASAVTPGTREAVRVLLDCWIADLAPVAEPSS